MLRGEAVELKFCPGCVTMRNRETDFWTRSNGQTTAYCKECERDRQHKFKLRKLAKERGVDALAEHISEMLHAVNRAQEVYRELTKPLKATARRSK